jgi:hypothetical protein
MECYTTKRMHLILKNRNLRECVSVRVVVSNVESVIVISEIDGEGGSVVVLPLSLHMVLVIRNIFTVTSPT